jgi:hypothetical protein
VVDQVFESYTGSPDRVRDEYTYTYDYAGSRLSRDNVTHPAFNEDYTYLCPCQLAGADFSGIPSKRRGRRLGGAVAVRSPLASLTTPMRKIQAVILLPSMPQKTPCLNANGL